MPEPTDPNLTFGRFLDEVSRRHAERPAVRCAGRELRDRQILSGIDVRVEADGFEPVEARLEITNPKLDGRLATTLQKIRATYPERRIWQMLVDQGDEFLSFRLVE